MSHYTVNYGAAGLSREEADEAAIQDIQEYLGDRWEILLGILESDMSISQLRFALTISGIQGYPIAALFRKYRLTAYRADLLRGETPIETDSAGFPLEKETPDEA